MAHTTAQELRLLQMLSLTTSARTTVAIFILRLVWLVFETSLALAQGTTAITPTTGAADLGTTATVHDHTVKITGGTRPGNGVNLFHSFDQFNVGGGDTAQFLDATPSLPTSNILSRVTGGNPSSIFGTIDTTGYPQANFFLMNPAGIIFGANATFNAGGSITFTTANYLRLTEANGSNAGIFHADPTVISLLTKAPISAFGFLGPTPAAIAVQSKLTVAPGKSISLVGGNQGFNSRNVSVPDGVTVVGGYLSAPDGQVNIASVASQGEILARSLNQTSNISGQSFGALGEVQVSKSAIENSSERGGTILIRGGRLVVDNSTIGANTAGIALDATSILITTTTLGTRTKTAANAGHITLKSSGDITIDSSLVGSESTTSSGNAGNIQLSSEEGTVSLSNSTVTSQANNISSGRSGNIKIAVPQGDILLTHSNVFNRAHVTGTLGNIQINARDLLLRDGSKIGGDNTSASATPGNFTITLDGHLNLARGSFINTGSFGSVASADLIIRAPEISITGTATDGFKSGLYTSTIGSGKGGRLRLFTDNLQLTDGGILSSKSLIGDAGEIPSGRGGVISVEGLRSSGPSITIDGAGSGIFTSAQGTGAAGGIVLKSTSVTLQNGGTISASSSGPGNAGNITINGDSLIVASGGRVEANTSSTGKGGSITIATTGDVTVTGLSADGHVRSGIFAKTLSGGGGSGGGSGGGNGGSGGGVSKPGKAGDITIEAKNLLLTGGAQIDSSTTSGGAGGSVSIRTAENITIAGSSTLLTSDATRGNGKGGSLTLVAKNITVRDNARVTAATGGKGDAGDISLTALNQLLLQSAGTVTTSTSGSGKGGTIVIQANQVLLDEQGTRISADTLPPFADMIITIKILHPNIGDLVVQLESPTGTRVALLSRVGGSSANFIGTQLNDRAPTQITSGSAPFTGTFTPREPLSQLNSELVAGNWALSVQDQTTGNVGSLESWTLQIGEQTFQSTGGPIDILDNDSVRSTITVANPTMPTVQGVGEAPGIGGNIVLTAGQSMTVSNGASVSASSTGSGNAGDISINAGQQFEMRDSSIATQATKASGGNIDIKAIDLISVTNSKISSSVQGGPSTAGGNITIDPKTVVLQNAQILASARQGTGGNITITTPVFLQDPTSRVDASSQFGLNGTVTIQSPTSNLSGTVGQLASKTSPPQVLLQNRCVALAGGEQSTFILTGRNTLPVEPGGWLSSPVSMEHWTGVSPEHASTLMVQSPSRRLKTWPAMITPKGEANVLSLRRLTPPGFLVQAFSTPSTGCPS